MRREFVCSIVLHAALVASFLYWRPSVPQIKPPSILKAHVIEAPKKKAVLEKPSPHAKQQAHKKQQPQKAAKGTAQPVRESHAEQASENATLNLLPQSWSKETPKETAEVLASASAARPKPEVDLRWSAKIKRDGQVEFKDEGFKLSPSFDLTELLMRLKGDTLHEPQKRKFLAQTQEQRLQLAKDSTRADLANALLQIQTHLTSIWQSKDLSLTDKKMQIFAMWDECAQSGSDQILQAARLIQASIEAFVKRELPKAADHAFTQEELKQLNERRTSKVPFTPYS